MLVTYNITLSLITKTNQGPRCFHYPFSRCLSPHHIKIVVLLALQSLAPTQSHSHRPFVNLALIYTDFYYFYSVLSL
jgi:hypothetical protein